MRLLVVDDEQSICWGITQVAKNIGLDVVSASTAEEGIELAKATPPDLMVLDVRLPGMDGLTAMQQFRNCAGNIPIIVMTAYGDLDTAVKAVKNGAYEYILKPFDLASIEAAIQRVLDSQSAENQSPHLAPDANSHGMIGSSPAMQEVFKQIALAASSRVGVLIQGESGTGKELVARAIHEYSADASGPFVAVNVAGLAPTLVESELFGHARGAFTGAETDRTGLIVAADGGTLFLDEVAEMPATLQAKLLRCLEHGEITPVGGTEPVRSHFRIVSATHQDLPTLVERGVFRHDLYYRLGGFQISVPPLRARDDDAVQIAHAIAETVSTATPPQFSSETLRLIRTRHWPGNVRELRNAVEYAVLLARGNLIQPAHFPEPEATRIGDATAEADLPLRIQELLRKWAEVALRDSTDAALHKELLQLVEPPVLQTALEFYDGQYASAARRLGMHRTTLKKRLDEAS